jgi:hypothetical protein
LEVAKKASKEREQRRIFVVSEVVGVVLEVLAVQAVVVERSLPPHVGRGRSYPPAAADYEMLDNFGPSLFPQKHHENPE